MHPRIALLVVATMLACKDKESGPPKPSSSATTTASAKSDEHDPKAMNVVELRDRRTTRGKEHDVVFRLVREGDEFAWTAKGVAVGTLGERVPDPLVAGPKPCVCGVEVKCDCESADESRDPIVSKTGRIAAAKVEAFVALVTQQPTRDGVDAGRGRASAPMAHLVAFWPGVEAALHVSRVEGTWLRAGTAIGDAPVDGGTTPVDAAWATLLAELDVPTWDTTLNPQPPQSLPADFANLAAAQSLEIFDSWNGMGNTHSVVVRLERSGANFTFQAKVSSDPSGVAESMFDPFDPKTEHRYVSCRCAIDALCECDHDAKLKHGTVPAAPVEAFLAEVARRGIDPPAPTRQGAWTDDYPRGHTMVWTSKAAAPIHLSFLDQQRQWRANGHELTPDPASAKPDPQDWQHGAINAAYRKMLDAIGLTAWMKTLRGRGGW
jgi:hypothetical protein